MNMNTKASVQPHNHTVPLCICIQTSSPAADDTNFKLESAEAVNVLNYLTF